MCSSVVRPELNVPLVRASTLAPSKRAVQLAAKKFEAEVSGAAEFGARRTERLPAQVGRFGARKARPHVRLPHCGRWHFSVPAPTCARL